MHIYTCTYVHIYSGDADITGCFSMCYIYYIRTCILDLAVSLWIECCINMAICTIIVQPFLYHYCACIYVVTLWCAGSYSGVKVIGVCVSVSVSAPKYQCLLTIHSQVLYLANYCTVSIHEFLVYAVGHTFFQQSKTCLYLYCCTYM